MNGTAPVHAVFRADASPVIGVGHVLRSLTIADVARAAGARTGFVSAPLPLAIDALLRRRGHEVSTVLATPGSEGDAQETLRLLAPSSLLVVDGYAFGTDYQSAVTGKGMTTCFVDDLADVELATDVVLNHNLYADALPLRSRPGTELLLGPRYALVASSFRQAREHTQQRGVGDVSSILVTMGGADPGGATLRVLTAMSRVRAISEARVVVVVGGANAHLDAIRERAQASLPRAVVVVDCPTMADEMERADLAITAGGTTCMELACVGVPSIVVAVAENQRGTAAALDAGGLMKSAGWYADLGGSGLAGLIEELVASQPTRREMVRKQRATVDGSGAGRVYDRLLARRASDLSRT